MIKMIKTVHPIILNIDASPESFLKGDGLSVRLALPADSWSVPHPAKGDEIIGQYARPQAGILQQTHGIGS